MRHSRSDNAITVVLSILIGIGAVVALTQMQWGVPDWPAWVWAFIAGFVLGNWRGQRRGRLIQAVAHSYKGVFKGHLGIIYGRKH